MPLGYKILQITCPVCGETRGINIPEKVFEQKQFGTIKIQVPVGAVCSDHQFIVFADPKANIIGYEKIDLYIATTETTEKEKAGILTLRVLINMFGTYGMFSIIHAKLFNYPVVIILDKDSVLYSLDLDLLNLIGERLLPEAYKEGEKIVFMEEVDYSKIKIKDKNTLIMDSHQHILQTPWDDKLKFEENLIKKALEISDEEDQLNLMQQNIAKLIEEAEHAKLILEKTREIFEDDLIDRIANDLMNPKINNYRLQLIKHFIGQRYSPKLAKKIRNRVEGFLDLL